MKVNNIMKNLMIIVFNLEKEIKSKFASETKN